jgi:hypothetical protein
VRPVEELLVATSSWISRAKKFLVVLVMQHLFSSKESLVGIAR